MTPKELEDLLVTDIAGFVHDPLGFVRYTFPWGKPGTVLAEEAGPREWQATVLREVGEKLRSGATAPDAIGEALALHPAPIQEAVASGHGIGKSALVSWLIMWGISTRENTRGVVTANTDTQLRTKTWPEVKKWHGLAINSHWFVCAATSLHSADPKTEKTWRIDAIPWSDTNTEAFAGLHNKGYRVLVIFDEASAIADKIWEVTEGAMTDEGTELLWFVFGNPTRNNGRFRECFGRLAHRWAHRQIDSRTVAGTNKVQIQTWVDDYGEDSDFVRVRVKGQFPRAGSMQLIASDLATEAGQREPMATLYDPLVMSIDVARFGDDESVIGFRRGRDARTIPRQTFRGIDTMTLSAHAAALIERYHPDMIFIDETGIGGAVVDRLRQLGYTVIGVNNGGVSDSPPEGENVANKGAECWVKMRQWLKNGAIDNDPDLNQQLTGRQYGYNVDNKIVLERKDDMKKRGLASPDRADQLALTFAYPVAKRSADGGSPGKVVTEFDAYA